MPNPYRTVSEFCSNGRQTGPTGYRMPPGRPGAELSRTRAGRIRPRIVPADTASTPPQVAAQPPEHRSSATAQRGPAEVADAENSRLGHRIFTVESAHRCSRGMEPLSLRFTDA